MDGLSRFPRTAPVVLVLFLWPVDVLNCFKQYAYSCSMFACTGHQLYDEIQLRRKKQDETYTQSCYPIGTPTQQVWCGYQRRRCKVFLWWALVWDVPSSTAEGWFVLSVIERVYTTAKFGRFVDDDEVREENLSDFRRAFVDVLATSHHRFSSDVELVIRFPSIVSESSVSTNMKCIYDTGRLISLFVGMLVCVGVLVCVYVLCAHVYVFIALCCTVLCCAVLCCVMYVLCCVMLC